MASKKNKENRSVAKNNVQANKNQPKEKRPLNGKEISHQYQPAPSGKTKRVKVMDEASGGSSSGKAKPLPRLVPPSATGYNITKTVLAEIYRAELKCAIFHVWLDCLYDDKLKFRRILDELEPIIGKEGRKYIHPRHVYIVGQKANSDSPVCPAGSCFILVPNSIADEEPNKIEAKILSTRARMIRVNIAMLRQQLKEKQSLIFSEGFKSVLTPIHQKYFEGLSAKRKLSTESSLSYVSSKSNEEPQPLPVVIKVSDLEANLTAAAARIPLIVKPNQVELSKDKEKDIQDEVATKSPFEESSESSIRSSLGELLIDLTKSDEDSCGEEMMVDVNNPQIVNEEESSLTKKKPKEEPEFIPVTSETLERALEIMSEFEASKRAVAIVFDPCFFMPNISIDYIRDKFQRIFGEIKSSQVLLRTNMAYLMRNVEEANASGIRHLNQAYIIAEEGLTDAEINRRAGATKIFCCPMTMGCVVNNIKRGIFLMSRKALLDKPSKINQNAFAIGTRQHEDSVENQGKLYE